MKKFLIKYAKNHIEKEYKYMTVIAECEQDAFDFFFKNYSGHIFEISFVDWA